MINKNNQSYFFLEKDNTRKQVSPVFIGISVSTRRISVELAINWSIKRRLTQVRLGKGELAETVLPEASSVRKLSQQCANSNKTVKSIADNHPLVIISQVNGLDNQCRCVCGEQCAPCPTAGISNHLWHNIPGDILTAAQDLVLNLKLALT